MKYSIIIPTYKLPLDKLQSCLESIYRFTYLEDKEIIVVANGQSSEVVGYLESLPWIKLLAFPEPLGYARAINKGLSAARGEFVVLLNDDIELLEQPKDMWIGYLNEPFWDNPRIGISGPLTSLVEITPEKKYEFVLFFCVMIKREVFLLIGNLDEGFEVGGYEDVDFCIRAQHAGFQLARVPIGNSSVFQTGEQMFSGLFPIYHEGSYTMTKLTEPQGIFEKNFERLKAKHGGANEGMIIGKNNDVPIFEKPRYLFATEFIKNWTSIYRRRPKILEIGCGSGYGLKFFKDLIESYVGVDYDESILKFATIDFGDDNVKFMRFDLQTDLARLEPLVKSADIVLGFEILEHLENLYEVFVFIVLNAKDFILSVPYNEDEKEKWWAHKHIHLTEQNFVMPNVGQKFAFQGWNGNIYYNPVSKDGIKTLLIYSDIVRPKYKILSYIVTRNRHNTTLPLCILSLINQTRPPDKILIVNDEPNNNWMATALYDYMVKMMHERKILFELINNPGQGQVAAHQFVNREYGKDYDWLWRIDDDEIASPNTLEGMETFIYQTDNGDLQIGAVGPACRLPNLFFDKNIHPLTDFGLQLEDIYLPNIQWSNYDTPIEVEHLHSTFLYKPNIVDYPNNLSRIGHREETIFTYEFVRQGYKLYALPYLTVSHLQMPSGGLREESDGSLWQHDENKFQQYVQYVGKSLKPIKWIVLANGLGDIFAFKQVLPEIIQKYQNHRIIIACNIPEAFWDYPDIKIIKIETAHKIIPDFDKFNVYYWMAQNKWTGTLVEAYRRIYG